ncbi:hypothetical protein J5N97_027554 [Dioscorea zingiberensis]|uniref:Helicase C-terminal domain-containing protein n=1 Tax=Dioscorea zingiberensis TaxID=325984 RepID=A0A9D5C4A2_9LILI|nr:hypothetical protein J5N97_027554 [Dioscorea zingiberensis]
MLKEPEKLPRLHKLLNDLGGKTAIVFCNTKKSGDARAKDLYELGYRVTTLHGGKSQEQREISLEGFRSMRFNILVATDVAGRGIDIPDIAHVINYEMPGSVDMYTHRIGRTGRAGKTGIATTVLTLHDTDVFYDLKQMLIQCSSPVPPKLARHEASKFKPGSIPDRPPRRNDTVSFVLWSLGTLCRAISCCFAPKLARLPALVNIYGFEASSRCSYRAKACCLQSWQACIQPQGAAGYNIVIHLALSLGIFMGLPIIQTLFR